MEILFEVCTRIKVNAAFKTRTDLAWETRGTV
jgi:hypothetical protein